MSDKVLSQFKQEEAIEEVKPVRKVKVGVIGCGRISVMHLSSIKALSYLELVCVCDIKRDRADEAAEKYGAELFDSRRLVFEHGFYQPIAEAIANWLTDAPLTVLDAGCGEGYYARLLAEQLQHRSIIAQVAGNTQNSISANR